MAKKRICSVDGCTAVHYGLGFCNIHYQRYRRLGDPLAAKSRGYQTRWVQTRVAELLVDPSPECVLVPWELKNGSYGKITVNGTKMRLNHAVLVLSGRPRPLSNEVTRHLCGNVPCINPGHIKVGTHLENSADCERHGRIAYGNKMPQTRITDDQVREIRASTEPPTVIGRRLGVHPSTVSNIRNGHRRYRVV